MAQKRITFRWPDALLLQAIALSGRGKPASLKDIIGFGDGLDKMTFSLPELSGGAARLIAARYVDYDARRRRFALSEAFAGEYRRITQGVQSLFDQLDKLETALNMIPYSPDYDPYKEDLEWAFPAINRVIYDRALKSYNTEMRIVLFWLDILERLGLLEWFARRRRC